MLFLLRGGGIIEILGNRNIEKYIRYSPYQNRLTSLHQFTCISTNYLMVFCVISVSSFLLSVLRNSHAVQFTHLSVLKQQLKPGLCLRPFQKFYMKMGSVPLLQFKAISNRKALDCGKRNGWQRSFQNVLFCL